MAKEQVAYLKLDKTQLTDEAKQELAKLAQSPLNI
jgi:hypothetical protein